MILGPQSFSQWTRAWPGSNCQKPFLNFQMTILQVEWKAGVTAWKSWHLPGVSMYKNIIGVSLPLETDFASRRDRLRCPPCYPLWLQVGGAPLSFPGSEMCQKVPSLLPLSPPLSSLTIAPPNTSESFFLCQGPDSVRDFTPQVNLWKVVSNLSSFYR